MGKGKRNGRGRKVFTRALKKGALKRSVRKLGSFLSPAARMDYLQKNKGKLKYIGKNKPGKQPVTYSTISGK